MDRAAPPCLCSWRNPCHVESPVFGQLNYCVKKLKAKKSWSVWMKWFSESLFFVKVVSLEQISFHMVSADQGMSVWEWKIESCTLYIVGDAIKRGQHLQHHTIYGLSFLLDESQSKRGILALLTTIRLSMELWDDMDNIYGFVWLEKNIQFFGCRSSQSLSQWWKDDWDVKHLVQQLVKKILKSFNFFFFSLMFNVFCHTVISYNRSI